MTYHDYKTTQDRLGKDNAFLNRMMIILTILWVGFILIAVLSMIGEEKVIEDVSEVIVK